MDRRNELARRNLLFEKARQTRLAARGLTAEAAARLILLADRYESEALRIIPEPVSYDRMADAPSR